MSAIPVLAKLAIPLGLGLVLLASRKGGTSAKAESLALQSVKAMNKPSASDLGTAIEHWRSDDGDSITADGLGTQQARMISRGSRGFTSQPTYDKDAVLGIDNREWAVRLIQLEGRTKALQAWATAYKAIGATNLANDLLDKAKALTPPKADKGSGKKPKPAKSDKSKPSSSSSSSSSSSATDAVAQKVADALASLDPAIMHQVAEELRKQGFKAQADSLDAAADEIAAQQKAGEVAPPAPLPLPASKPEVTTPKPVVLRTVTVTSKLNSESAIAKFITGNGNRFGELVAANIPKDADGRTRRKVGAADIANGTNPNRLNGLTPGLVVGQKLFVPASWPSFTEAGNTKPTPPTVVKPDAGPKPQAPSDALTKQLMTMLVGKHPGQEDSFMVKKWQTQEGRTVDGKYGSGDAIHLADKYDVAPPTPLYWSKKDTVGDLKKWKSEMARLALELPAQSAAFQFAADAGKQPGFSGVPTSAKVTSRLLGDGLGPA